MSSVDSQTSFWKGIDPQGVGLHKTNIKIVVCIILILVGFLAILGFGGSKTQVREERNTSNGTSMPTEIISSLPKDYANWSDPKPKVLSNKQVYQEETKQSKSEVEKFLDQERVRKLKRAIAARESDLFVPGFEIPKNNRASLADSDPKFGKTGKEELGENDQLNPRDQDNRQDEKLEFLYKKRQGGERLHSRLQKPRSPYELLAGTVIPGVLLTGLNSDLPGKIIGQVSQNIYDTVDGRYLLIPQGTKLLGQYDSRVSYGQERILIVWSRLVLPNGSSISLDGMPGVGLAGKAGLRSKVNNHYGKLFSGVVLGSVIGASAQAIGGPNRTLDPSFQELAVQGAAGAINQAGQEITKRNLNIQPTLEVDPGSRFNVFVTKDIVLEPYRKE